MFEINTMAKFIAKLSYICLNIFILKQKRLDEEEREKSKLLDKRDHNRNPQCFLKSSLDRQEFLLKYWHQLSLICSSEEKGKNKSFWLQILQAKVKEKKKKKLQQFIRILDLRLKYLKTSLTKSIKISSQVLNIVVFI